MKRKRSKPRNHLIAEMLKLKQGAHEKTEKAKRRRLVVELKRQVAEGDFSKSFKVLKNPLRLAVSQDASVMIFSLGEMYICRSL